jgi:hypothetical protein
MGMNLSEMIQEFLSVPDYEITVQGYDTSKLNSARAAFIKSLRNTLNREIENSLDVKELWKLIDTFELTLEKTLVIALYRRYLWLCPTDFRMYHNFVKCVDAQKQDDILRHVNNNDFDAALTIVEGVFNALFNDPTLVKPINMRTVADMAEELCELEYCDKLPEMEKTSARDNRYYYLMEQFRQRIIDPRTNIVELRDFFSLNPNASIILDCDIGLEIAKRYLNENPTDREMYCHILLFLRFWHLLEDETVLLQYIAVNDFDNALKVVNSIKY